MYLLKINYKNWRHLTQVFFISQSSFVSDAAQLYLIFQALYYTLKRLGDTEKVVSWKSKGLSTEKLTTPITTDNSLSPSIFCLSFKGSCLKQKNATFTPPNIIIFFIVYKLNAWSRDLNSDFNLKDCLFGGVKLAKNADLDKYVYSGYSIGFDSRSEFPLTDSSVGKNAIIFGVDMSSSVNTDNKK